MQRYNYSRNSYKPRSLRRNENKAKTKLISTIIIGGILIIIFIFWGLPTLVGALQFINRLKDSPKIVVEEDAAIAPPVLNIPYEATNSATIKINGFATANSEVEIYIDDDLKTTVSTTSEGLFTTGEISLNQGINNIYGKTLNDQGKKSLDSKTIRLTFSNEKPKLEISSPSENQEIKGGDKKIIVSGKTEPLNTVTVNGTTVIVSSDGNFSTTLNINDGENFITIVTTDQFGNNNQIERKVSYSPS